jgi:hypothetical protein
MGAISPTDRTREHLIAAAMRCDTMPDRLSTGRSERERNALAGA